MHTYIPAYISNKRINKNECYYTPVTFSCLINNQLLAFPRYKPVQVVADGSKNKAAAGRVLDEPCRYSLYRFYRIVPGQAPVSQILQRGSAEVLDFGSIRHNLYRIQYPRLLQDQGGRSWVQRPCYGSRNASTKALGYIILYM